MFTSDQFEFVLLNPKVLKLTNYFLCGFVLFAIGDILSQIGTNFMICQSMKILGLILFTPSSIFLINVIFNKDLLNRDVTNVFSKEHVETFSKSLALPTTFLILVYSYQSKKTKMFAFFIAAIAILFAIIRARRGLLFIIVGPMLFALNIYL